MTRSRQAGATVIIALLVVALVTILAGKLAATQERWYRQVKLEGDRLQALALADAAIDYGRAVLADDERRGVVDHRNEAWAQPLPQMSVEGGLLTGSIEDVQGRLNLNTVVLDARPAARLWSRLGLPGEQIAALADFIDADSETRFPGGGEDQYYLSMRRPYRPANTPLVGRDDLLAVRGFDARTLVRLGEAVAVYPAGSAVNVNTASPAVLAAVVPGLDERTAERLWKSVEAKPLATPAEVAERLQELGWSAGGSSETLPALAVGSRYFLVRGEVRWGEASVRMQVLVERAGGGSLPRILWKQMEAFE